MSGVPYRLARPFRSELAYRRPDTPLSGRHFFVPIINL